MSFSIPIYCFSHSGEHIIGILVARIDLENSLYALLLNRTGMGETGETLIVNKDVMALNELRWHERAPLRFKIQAKPALKASEGETGITETDDYRGKKALAAYALLHLCFGALRASDAFNVNFSGKNHALESTEMADTQPPWVFRACAKITWHFRIPSSGHLCPILPALGGTKSSK